MVKSFKLSNGRSLKFVKDPRYGYWSLRTQSGPVPNPLDGTWTEFKDLFNAAERHYRTKNVNILVD